MIALLSINCLPTEFEKEKGTVLFFLLRPTCEHKLLEGEKRIGSLRGPPNFRGDNVIRLTGLALIKK
jgi:hypothetical protein